MSTCWSHCTRSLALLVCAGIAGCSESEPTRGEPQPASAATPIARPDAAQTETPQPWTPLLGSPELSAWRVLGDANWRLEDGVVQADAGRGFLVSQDAYADFELRIEFWASADANSGVCLRCSDPANVTPETAYEVNIFDQRPDQTYRTGGIVDVAAPAEVIVTADQWNRYEIRAQGGRLRVQLNGALLVDAEDERLARGPIALQYGAGTIRFRNAEIRPL